MHNPSHTDAHTTQNTRHEQHHDQQRSTTIRIDSALRMPGRDTSRAGHAPGRTDAPGLTNAPSRDSARCDTCERIRAHVSQALGANRVRRYLNANTAMRADNDGSIEICAGDSFTLDMIQRRLGDAIRIGAQFVLGTTEPVVRFRVAPALNGHAAQSSHAAASQSVPAGGAPAPAKPTHPLATRTPDRQRRRGEGPSWPTLDQFIVGASNRLALESIKQVIGSHSECPPVFVHGSCGVGKTHLLRGATSYARQLRPGCKVRYTTGEAFTNAFVNAIRTRSIEAFQKKYRGLDLLCIDDIHLMAGKQATQHELLQIFNTLSLGGARIILASDAHPREIARLDQALASRFAAGLVVRVEEPDRELAARLITHIARKRGMFLDDAAIGTIIDRVGVGGGASVRDLEGAVLQIQAVARLLDKGTPYPNDATPGSTSGTGGSGTRNPTPNRGGGLIPTLAHVRQALSLRAGGDDEGAGARGPIALDTIVSHICRELTVSKPDLLGKGRQKKVVLARELIVHLSRNLTSKSFPEIASAIGRPNHSTVITAAKRFRDRLTATDPVRVGCPHDGIPAAELAQLLTTRIRQAGA